MAATNHSVAWTMSRDPFNLVDYAICLACGLLAALHMGCIYPICIYTYMFSKRSVGGYPLYNLRWY